MVVRLAIGPGGVVVMQNRGRLCHLSGWPT
jgi:hypothetical protein